MVSMTILTSLLTLSVSTANAYWLPLTPVNPPIYKGDLPATTPNHQTRDTLPPPSWDTYNKATHDLTNLGLCRYYIDRSSCCDNLVMCQRYCNSDSVTCRAGDYKRDPSTIGVNPNNEQYTMGVCECDVDVERYIAELFVDMTQDAGPIICEVWLESFNFAGQIFSTMRLPASVPIKLFKQVLKGVKKADKFSGKAGFDIINSAITKTCGSDVIDVSKKDIYREAYELLAKIDINNIKV